MKSFQKVHEARNFISLLHRILTAMAAAAIGTIRQVSQGTLLHVCGVWENRICNFFVQRTRILTKAGPNFHFKWLIFRVFHWCILAALMSQKCWLHPLHPISNPWSIWHHFATGEAHNERPPIVNLVCSTKIKNKKKCLLFWEWDSHACLSRGEDQVPTDLNHVSHCRWWWSPQ